MLRAHLGGGAAFTGSSQSSSSGPVSKRMVDGARAWAPGPAAQQLIAIAKRSDCCRHGGEPTQPRRGWCARNTDESIGRGQTRVAESGRWLRLGSGLPGLRSCASRAGAPRGEHALNQLQGGCRRWATFRRIQARRAGLRIRAEIEEAGPPPFRRAPMAANGGGSSGAAAAQRPALRFGWSSSQKQLTSCEHS